MNYEEVYLIHKEDYLRHIQEKLELYHYARQLAALAQTLPDTADCVLLKAAAAFVNDRCEALFDAWGGLESLLENELILPEEGGYEGSEV